MNKQSALEQIKQAAFEDELEKISVSLETLQRMAEKEEQNLKSLETDFPKAYMKRNVGAAIGAIAGAGGGAAVKRARIPLAVAGGLLGLVGGMGIGHQVAKAQDPKFKKRFEGASTKYTDALADYAVKYDSMKRPVRIKRKS